jgi:hypothetical protein
MRHPCDDEMNIILPWKPDEPCPCGTNLPLKDCCLGPGGVPRINVPNLVPTGPPTMHGNESCYLKDTLNCSTKISKEHYISRSILQQLGEPLRWTGLPWEKPGVEIKYGMDSLTSHILCDRHNSALSPLDQPASNAFRLPPGHTTSGTLRTVISAFVASHLAQLGHQT